MYGHGFEDLDGHLWELIYMEPNAQGQGQGGCHAVGFASACSRRELAGQLDRFHPLPHRERLAAGRLAVQDVVEFRLGVNLAVVDVYGREEQFFGIGPRNSNAIG